MHIDGNVSGDVGGGDKTVTQTAGGDIVGGDKLTHTGTGHIFAGSGDVLVIQPQLSPASARDRANLRALLNKVKTFWIEGVLERSVHDAFLLELGLELRAEAVDHPWASVLELPDASRRELPPGTPVSQVFEEANRALLILGEPGSGKTITLLELARDLIQRASADVEALQPIPVVFNLSSWHTQRLPLGAWMAGELASKYQVPIRIGQGWLQEQRLLPLLDGLDEVAPAWQSACVTEINRYTGRQGLPGVVICCRLEEYARLPNRLRLNGAICLSPLSPEQVNGYLQAGGDGLAALRQVMQGDDVLAVLAQTPLFLSIMRLAYQDLPATALTGLDLNTVEERRHHLFGQYVARMLKRKGSGRGRYADAVLLKWVTWLARQMALHNQTVYLIERMQPSWLGGPTARWIYALASRAAGWSLLGGLLAVALAIWFLSFLNTGDSVAEVIASMVTIGHLLGTLDLAWGLAGRFAFTGLVAGLICGARFALSTRRDAAAAAGPPSWWSPGLNVLGGSVLPPLFVLIPRLAASFAAAGALSLTRLVGLALFDLPVIFLSVVAFRTWDSGDSPIRDIARVDSLNWSWLQSVKGALAGFVGGGVLGSACALTFIPGESTLVFIVTVILAAMPTGLVGAAAVGLIAGMRARAIAGTPETSQWVARHARNALVAGLTVGLGTGLCATLSASSFAALARYLGTSGWPELIAALGVGLASAVALGTVGALYYGGFSLIQHVVLRLILIVQGRIPWNLPRIADQAEDMVFLRRVGGGYIFIHRLVMEYFASLPELKAVANSPHSP